LKQPNQAMFSGWRNVGLLTRYWLKGRLTRATLIWIAFGETFALASIAFGSQVLLSFSSKFATGGAVGGFTEFSLSLIFAFILVGLLQAGFAGSGLPVTSADVDYVFTSPVRPREIFGAKVLMNSFTTIVFSFPPMVFLYIMLANANGTSLWTAIPAGVATLVFLITGLFLSADVTLSLTSNLGSRMKLVRNILVFGVAAMGIVPVVLLIPSVPSYLAPISQILPSGLAANLSIKLVSGTGWNLNLVLDAVGLAVWFSGALLLGIRMSRAHFYEVLQVTDSDTAKVTGDGKARNLLKTKGRSVWSVVRTKESVIMRRSKERRGLLVSSLFLSTFMIIYSLAGTFQSSPTSFLFILFLVGSFGSGNATGWLEKERLWIIRTSAIDIRKYVREVYEARVTPLLLFLLPVTVAVGIPLVYGTIGTAGSYAVLLALPTALEVAAVMMGGGMYFAARFGQSTTDDILSSQAQQLTDVKRFLYQTIVNLVLVSPLMAMVLIATQSIITIPVAPGPLALVLFVAAGVYTLEILRRILNSAGNRIAKREDL